ncbi:MAG: hypothetical protein LC753_02440, partial [Acidobacteria bacterium]|nr:hypothetical protein [Acidobacteriota bacterium]
MVTDSAARRTAYALVGLSATVWLALPLAALMSATPNIRETHVEARADWHTVAIELEHGTPTSDTERQLFLSIPQLDRLIQHERLDLAVVTLDRGVGLERAVLRIEAAVCEYIAAAVSLRGTTRLPFRRTGDCRVPGRSQRAVLYMTLAADARVAVAAFLPAVPLADPSLIYVSEHPVTSPVVRPILRVRFVEAHLGPMVSRFHLLQYVWQLRPGLLTACLAGTAAAVLSGLLLLCFSLRAASRTQVGLQTGAVALLAFGAATSYGVLIPPFQAPDETSHFLTYGAATGQRQFEAETEAWARLGHVGRIQFDAAERFRPSDVGTPYSLRWRVAYPQDLERRSGIAAPLWRTWGDVIARRPVQEQLLFLRLLHAAIFALAAGAGTAAFAASAGETHFPLPLVALLAPTVPFFAMHVSDHAILTAGYVLFASAAAAIVINGVRAHWVGLPLGVATALMLGTGRSAAPLMPLLVAICVVRLILAARERPSIARSLVFWCGVALPPALALTLVAGPYRDFLTAGVVARAPRAVAPIVDWLAGGAAWLLTGAIGLLAERGVRRRTVTDSSRAQWVVRVAALSAVAYIVVVCVASLFVSLPLVSGGAATSASEYVRRLLLSALTWPRLDGLDLMLTTSFWAGFGWLDTFPPGLAPTLTAVMIAAAVWLLVNTAVHRDVAVAWSLAVICLGGLASLALYGLATQEVHGRYLTGLYLTAIMICWTPWS